MSILLYITLVLIPSLLFGMNTMIEEIPTNLIIDKDDGTSLTNHDMFDTPTRIQLSIDFNDLSLSAIGCTYSPNQEQRKPPDSQSEIVSDKPILQGIDDIIHEWRDAQEKIKKADEFLQKDNLTFQERNHYRAECLIIGLNTLYTYRDVVIKQHPEKQREHQDYMTRLLLSTRIALALSYTSNGKQLQNDSIKEKCEKLSTSLNVVDTIQIDDQNTIKLPTMPIKIKKGL